MSLRAPGFARVYRTGVRSRRGAILVLQAPGQDGPPRVGVVAGRKVGHAVQRNRAKRRMREAVRRVTLKPATDYVLVASHEILDAPFDEVLAAVVDALEAIRMKTEGSRS